MGMVSSGGGSRPCTQSGSGTLSPAKSGARERLWPPVRPEGGRAPDGQESKTGPSRPRLEELSLLGHISILVFHGRSPSLPRPGPEAVSRPLELQLGFPTVVHLAFTGLVKACGAGPHPGFLTQQQWARTSLGETGTLVSLSVAPAPVRGQSGLESSESQSCPSL